MGWRHGVGVAALVAACGTDGGDGASESGGAETGTGGTTVVPQPTIGPSGSATSTLTSSSGDPGSSSGGTSESEGSTSTPTSTTEDPPVGDGGSFDWVLNEVGAHDYGRQLTIPAGFGEGEFTLQLWIKPNASFPTGPINGDTTLTNWAEEDVAPYDGGDSWYTGNFLLDGHNNLSGFEQGTFSLQFYGAGRVRWLFGDGGVVDGGVWSAGAYPADNTDSLLDDAWHHLTLVRRFTGGGGAELELWIDGALVDAEPTPERTNMRTYWDAWPGFGEAQAGWFWGAEKQAAIGVLSSYEDYKGLMADLRFWDNALDPGVIADTWGDAITGDEAGLVGWFPWNEGAGTAACDALDATNCADLLQTEAAQWVDEGPP